MTFNELQSFVFEIANLLNQRPIGIKPTDGPELQQLCPNDLILGRASANVPGGKFDMEFNPKKRFLFIQKLINEFWKRWNRYYFHTLIIRQKWHTSSRNLCKGDIVIVQETSSIRGTWKLAEVLQADPGKDGNVRDVTIRYKPTYLDKGYSGAKDITINRPVHKLVLILPIEQRYSYS